MAGMISHRSLLIALSGIALTAIPSMAAAPPLADILKNMQDDSFEKRQATSDDLAKWAKENNAHVNDLLDKLFLAHKEHDSPEVRVRCHILMKDILVERKLRKGTGYCGVCTLESATTVDGVRKQAALITSVVRGTPAEAAGLKHNDAIFRVDDIEFSANPNRTAKNQFSGYLKGRCPDDKVTLHLVRNKKVMQVEVKLGTYPSDDNKAGQDAPNAQRNPPRIQIQGNIMLPANINKDEMQQHANEEYFNFWYNQKQNAYEQKKVTK